MCYKLSENLGTRHYDSCCNAVKCLQILGRGGRRREARFFAGLSSNQVSFNFLKLTFLKPEISPSFIGAVTHLLNVVNVLKSILHTNLTCSGVSQNLEKISHDIGITGKLSCITGT